MKTLLKYLSLSLLIMFGAELQTADAQVRPAKRRAAKRRAAVVHHKAHKHAVTRERSRRFLKRTNLAIFAARNHVKRGKNYTGDLARSYHHQRFARVLFRRGMYRRAVFHSRRARMFAFAAIQANKGKVNNSYDWESDDDTLFDGMPGDTELDSEMQKEFGELDYRDEDFINNDLKGITLDENDMGPAPGK